MRDKKQDEWMEEIGRRLEATRIALGVLHVDLAKVAGVSPQRWSNYVNGLRPLDIKAAALLCNRYQLTLDWIYRGILAGLPHELAQRLAHRPAG